ncbi:MAG: MATE family efflux transporter [Geodermatophilaceae bacterium]|nr:MATE family efflux transporter [Geodermatophilaceae bacterium]
MLSLAVPALAVLAAEPLYLLVDTAVVGHLGALSLAGLAIGGALFAVAAVQFNFLAYGTTARAARLHGLGRREAAVAEGVQASWLALAIGLVMVAVIQVFAGPLTTLLAGGATLEQAAAEQWLRIAVLGAPFLLLSLAGNGWMRGVQDTKRPWRYVLFANALSAVLCPVLVYGAGLGLPGSAVANVVAQLVGGVLFLRALQRTGVAIRPDRVILLAQLRVGRDLTARTVALQACFLIAAAVAARLGTAQVGAHQIALQLFFFLALVLDSFAIAAQALVGESLGAGRVDQARATAWRVTRYGAAVGGLAAVLLLAGFDLIPRVFTPDEAVVEQAQRVWWWFAVMQPVAGVVFALDGVLMGAGDVAYLRSLTLAASVVGFLPLLLLTLPLDLGLPGVWAGLVLLIVIRLLGLVWRVRSGRWAVVGARA